MKAQVLSNFPMLWLTCLGLLIFFSIFMGSVFWVFRKSGQSVYRELESLPLREEG